mmetsp:Transcript_5995/g.14609  ORF Transcript_5995/g.14609 Transcript_5995/m.14609 type:complete len:276 (+) Transcript_5995:545-1372(+)
MPAAPLEPCVQQALHKSNTAEVVNVHQHPIDVQGRVLGQIAKPTATIVDEHVDATECLLGILDLPGQQVQFGEIEDQHLRLHARPQRLALPLDALELALAAGAEDQALERGPLAQRHAERLAKTSRGAGDPNDLALEVLGGGLLIALPQEPAHGCSTCARASAPAQAQPAATPKNPPRAAGGEPRNQRRRRRRTRQADRSLHHLHHAARHRSHRPLVRNPCAPCHHRPCHRASGHPWGRCLPLLRTLRERGATNRCRCPSRCRRHPCRGLRHPPC